MLSLKICCLGLLLSSFTNAPVTDRMPVHNFVVQAVHSQRICGNRPAAIRYVVLQTPQKADEPIKVRFAAEYYGAKPLGPEGVWKLKNGITVAGQAYETPDMDLLLIRKANSADPAEVYVRLDDFAASDQEQLKSHMSKYGNLIRYQHLPVIERGIKRWNGPVPQYAKAFYQIVAVEEGQVFAVNQRRLFAVPENAIDAAELAVLKQKFEEHGGGRYLEVTKFARYPFAGKLVAETDDYFVLETGERSQTNLFRYPNRTRYRMPKYLLSDVLVRQLQAINKRYGQEQGSESLTTADLLAMPCARQTSIGMRLCFPNTQPSQDFVEALSQQGAREKLQMTALACTDRVQVEYEALIHSGKRPSAELRNSALLTVADAIGEHPVWQLQHAAPANVGKPLGAIDDGFAFALGYGKRSFFVKARQLEEVDRKVLEIAFQRDHYKWLSDVNPEELFQTRLIVTQRSTAVARLESKEQYDAAISGQFLKPQYANSSNPFFLSGLRVDTLSEASDADVYIGKYAPLIASNNRAAAIQKIAAMRQKLDEPLPGLSQHVPNLKRETWTVGGDKTRQFYGTLAGKWDDDFVFHDEFNGKKKYFLAASSALSDDSRERAEELSARLPAEDWEKVVARADNWQYFRILYAAETQETLGAYPSVIVEPRSFGLAVQDIHGARHTTLWAQAGGEEAGRAMLQLARTEAAANREKAEKGFPTWTFRDSSQSLVAHFVGDYGDDVLLRDVNGTEFLMFKMSFEESSLKELARLSQQTAKQPQLTQAERHKLPRMWCSYDALLGPAELVNYTAMSRASILVKEKSGSYVPWPLASLTRRERLATKALWLRQSQNLEDDRSFDTLLTKPVASSEVLHQTPKLLPAIQQRIDKAWQVHKSELAWQSSPIRVDASAELITVDRDATCGIIVDGDKKWQIIDFATGKQQSLQELSHAPTLGPWLYRGTERVWWVEEGQLKTWTGNGRVAQALSENKLQVTLADQSGDFESIVLHFSDDSIAKLELSTGQLQQLRATPNRIMSHAGATLVASLDGSAVMLSHQNTVTANVFARTPDDPEGNAFAGVSSPPRVTAISRTVALGSTEDSPKLFAMSPAVQGILPESLNLPFVPQLFGFVNLGTDAEEELQAIGKLNDKFSRATDTAIVYPTSIEGQHRKHQTIEGEFDKNAVMAGNGSAVVHKQKGQYVVSRRPAHIPLTFRVELYHLATDLLKQLDIGQLEAVVRYLQQPPFLSDCSYNGETADSFFNLTWRACLDLEPHIGGDRLERGLLAIKKMLQKFPKSHVARNLLVAWHRDSAWEARGGGYADTVSKKGWEIFHSEFQKAQIELKPLLGQPDTIAATYKSALDIAVATGASRDSMRRLATEILSGPHAANTDLHKSVMQYLLPRWHGEPGMSEAYATNVAKQLGNARGGDAVYAKMVADISDFSGPNGPVTVDMDIDLDRLFQGTKDYYAQWNNPNVMDLSLVLLHLSQRTGEIEELMRLRAAKRILPGAAARGGWKTFQAIEASIE